MRRKAMLAAVAAALALAALVVVMRRPPAREVTLVTRGMAFYAAADPATPNPVIRARRGERLRVTLRNEDRGIVHDFAVPDVEARTRLLNWNEEDAVTFDVPETPGAYEYHCTPHRLMMKGALQVQ